MAEIALSSGLVPHVIVNDLRMVTTFFYPELLLFVLCFGFRDNFTSSFANYFHYTMLINILGS